MENSTEEAPGNRRVEAVPPGAGKSLSVVGDVYTIRVNGDDTGGAYAMVEMFVPPQGGPLPHIHARYEEAFYILEGEILYRTVDESLVAAMGTWVNVPRGVAHSFNNTGTTPARLLCLLVPAGMEKFFLEVGHPVPDPTGPPVAMTDADQEKFSRIAAKYGIELLPPDFFEQQTGHPEVKPSPK